MLHTSNQYIRSIRHACHLLCASIALGHRGVIKFPVVKILIPEFGLHPIQSWAVVSEGIRLKLWRYTGLYVTTMPIVRRRTRHRSKPVG